VFEELADFGWDYFQIIQKASLDEPDISWGDACRFHDHSDIFGWKNEVHVECPFLHDPQPLIFSQNMAVLPSMKNKHSEEALAPGDEILREVEGTREDDNF
jgi:hypothetical protein